MSSSPLCLFTSLPFCIPSLCPGTLSPPPHPLPSLIPLRTHFLMFRVMCSSDCECVCAFICLCLCMCMFMYVYMCSCVCVCVSGCMCGCCSVRQAYVCHVYIIRARLLCILLTLSTCPLTLSICPLNLSICPFPFAFKAVHSLFRLCSVQGSVPQAGPRGSAGRH